MSKEQFTGHTFTAQEKRSHHLRELIYHYLDPTRPLRILDIGCGVGTLLFDLVKVLPLAHGTGVDISEANIQIANNSLQQLGLEKRLTFVAMDYMEFCAEEPFDLIFTYSTLPLIPISTEQLYSKIAADLTSEGILINCMPYECLYNQFLYLIRRLLRAIRGSMSDIVILTIAKALHGHQMSDSMLRERLIYMYTLPTHYDCPALRQFLYTHCQFALVAEHPEPHASIGQFKHRSTVFRKEDMHT
jgi:trans-aconitate methyltransferase